MMMMIMMMVMMMMAWRGRKTGSDGLYGHSTPQLMRALTLLVKNKPYDRSYKEMVPNTCASCPAILSHAQAHGRRPHDPHFKSRPSLV